MKFETPATTNPIDQLKVVGQPISRIDGPLKTTGTAPYAYERHDVVAEPGVRLCRRVGDRARGGSPAMDLTPGQSRARRARDRHGRQRRQARQGQAQHRQTARRARDPALSSGHRRGRRGNVRAGARRGAADPRRLRRGSRARSISLRCWARPSRARITGGPADTAVGDFAGAFAAAPVRLDARYTTPDEAHAMMEPHATIAAWQGDKLTLMDLEPDDRLEQGGDGQDARHSEGECPRRFAVHRRRLRRQAVPARRCAAGGARRARGADGR